jgi:hypothetical protein
VAAAVAAHHLRVDRVDLVAGGQQGSDQQAPVGLDPDRHLGRVLGVGGDQRVQLPDPGQPVGNPPNREHVAVLVQQAQVMVALAPVHPDKQHGVLLRSDNCFVSQGRTCGALMAGSVARHPTSRPPSLNTGRGTLSPESSTAPFPPSAHQPAAPP